MTTKTHTGSCHCGAVRFEVDLDLEAGTKRCNCSFCTKVRNWGVTIAPSAFRLLTSEDALTFYGHTSPDADVQHPFCKTCGVRPFSRGNVEQMGGPWVSIQVACLDDASPDELLSGPIQFCDGRANAWWTAPTETRHL